MNLFPLISRYIVNYHVIFILMSFFILNEGESFNSSCSSVSLTEGASHCTPSIVNTPIINEMDLKSSKVNSIPIPGAKPIKNKQISSATIKAVIKNDAKIWLANYEPSKPITFEPKKQNPQSKRDGLLGLVDVYLQGLRTDKQLESSRLSIEAAEQGYLADKSQVWGPKVKLTASLGYGSQNISGVNPNGGFTNGGYNQSAGASLSQTIFSLPDMIQVDKANYEIQLQNLQYAVDLQNYISKTVLSYFNVVKYNKLIVFKQKEIDASEEILEFLYKQREAEIDRDYSITEAKSRLDFLKAEKSSLEVELSIAENTFMNFWTIDGSKLKSFKKNLIFKIPEPFDLNYWQHLAITNNLAVQYNEGLIKLSEFDIKKVSGGYFVPEIRLNGRYGTQNTSSSFLGESDFSMTSGSVGIEFSMSIFDGFYTKNKINELTTIKEKIKTDTSLLKQNTKLTAFSSFKKIENLRYQIDALKSSVKNAQSSYDGKKETLEYDGVTLFELMSSLTALNQFKSKLLNEQINYIINMINLKLTAGILTEADLIEIDNYLE